MDKKELLAELEKEFNKLKKQMGLKYSLNDLDSIFFIRDYILATNFVSKSLSRQICSRMSETYVSWIATFHSLIVPQPYNIVEQAQCNLFDDKEKEEFQGLIGKIMELATLNKIAGLTKDKDLEKEFIEKAFEFWKKSFGPKLTKIIKKINKGWKK